MFIYPCPIPTVIVFQQVKPDMPLSLCLKDPKLAGEIPAQELNSGNFRSLAKWVNAATKVSIGTTESEMSGTKDFFVFGKVRAGDLMEAYGLLYRMRWVKYRQGRPNYELTLAKDAIDGVYAPQDDFQKRRFESTKTFIKSFDEMDPLEKEKIFSGQPLDYAELPQKMKDSLKAAIGALIEGGRTKPDINALTEARITIKDDSAPGAGLRELCLSVGTNIGDFSFRWNDYDKAKNNFSSPRPVAFFQEPLADEVFSKEQMVAKSKKLGTLITIKQNDYTLASLLKYLSTSYGVNFIANEDTQKRSRSFSCENLPLNEAMDRMSKEYGDWEWELAPGDFIVMRSPGSPRRRSLLKDNP